MAGGDGLGRVEGRGTVAGAIQKGIEDEGVLVAGVELLWDSRTERQDAEAGSSVY